jgi:hypothetical protein
MLVAWCWFAAAILIVNLVVYVSTFLATDPMAKWPGIMFINSFAILPALGTAGYYNWRLEEEKGVGSLFRLRVAARSASLGRYAQTTTLCYGRLCLPRP